MNPEVDRFIANADKWQAEFVELRRIALGCGLTEELKWGKPCYTFQGGNVAILQGFKESIAVLFPKGALFKDSGAILEKPGENTQAARRIPFTDLGGILKLEPVLKAYLQEAIEVEKARLEVSYKSTADFVIPGEFEKKLDAVPALRSAFEALTPGRQRAYLLHFAAAKQSKTRTERIEKLAPRILAGRGLRDE